MPNGETCKVVTNPRIGTIKFYGEDGNLMDKYEDLREGAVRIIERNYLETVSIQIRGTKKAKGTEVEMAKCTG